MNVFIFHIFSDFELFDWLITLALFVLLGIQLTILFRNKPELSLRFWIKLSLNLLLWLTVTLLFINPDIEKSMDSNKVLLVSENIPKEEIKLIKDSLKISETFNQKAFNRLLIEKPEIVEQLGNVYLLGQDAQPEILSKISSKNIYWIPFFPKETLQDLHWKAILYKDEIQEVSGKIYVEKPQIIRLKWANKVLDSLSLSKGFSYFRLKTPTFSVGKTDLSLDLADKTLAKIHFFSTRYQPQHYLFVLSNPDFESKILADWLGKNGNIVETIATVAKNTQSTFSINQSGKFVPDVIITDPSNAGNTLVKKAFAEGKSILFINFANADLAVKSINQQLGTNWKITKIDNQENRKISEDLTAQSYKFLPNTFQKELAEYPVAIQKKVGKVAISLLNETFPLMLSGDSIKYSRIWQSTFQALNAPKAHNFNLIGPVFVDVTKDFSVNSTSDASNLLIEKVSSQSTQSAINSKSFNANYIFRKKGWNQFQDTLAIFVEDNTSSIAKAKQLAPYLQTSVMENVSEKAQTFRSTLPEWLWFVLILLLLTALWVEPKL
ncbi:hypothetical protein [Arcicella rigui]|uniref:Aerotolerance regulator N-terminal domain-containing protein n=1 Tax=Arcicella rigui TaxID=797020 RepID=A0ABU5Q740_9BACT|nr:hypothetical protein [Arcicella rigui]MEA5138660.1 hypothetical protein [Arcicella rigui]